jgi:hypothetical protein
LLKSFFDESVSILCFSLYVSFSDSLQSVVDLKLVSWVLSCLYFSVLLALEGKKRIHSQVSYFEAYKKKKIGFLFG